MTRETLIECPQCGQARPLHGRCPYHEGPGCAVVAPMQVHGVPATTGPVTLAPAPHTLGGQRQEDHLYRELRQAERERDEARRQADRLRRLLLQAAEWRDAARSEAAASEEGRRCAEEAAGRMAERMTRVCGRVAALLRRYRRERDQALAPILRDAGTLPARHPEKEAEHA